MPLGFNPIRWPWRVQRKLKALAFVHSEGGADVFDSVSSLAVLEMLLDAELDRLRDAGKVSGEMETYIQQDAPLG